MGPKKYLKFAPIYAIEWTGTPETTKEIIAWAKQFEFYIDLVSLIDEDTMVPVPKLRIPTLEGPMYASIGDYIAKGVKPEFWAIKPDVMTDSYREVPN